MLLNFRAYSGKIPAKETSFRNFALFKVKTVFCYNRCSLSILAKPHNPVFNVIEEGLISGYQYLNKISLCRMAHVLNFLSISTIGFASFLLYKYARIDYAIKFTPFKVNQD